MCLICSIPNELHGRGISILFNFKKAEFDGTTFQAGASRTAYELYGRGVLIRFAVYLAEPGCGTADGDGGSRTRVQNDNKRKSTCLGFFHLSEKSEK